METGMLEDNHLSGDTAMEDAYRTIVSDEEQWLQDDPHTTPEFTTTQSVRLCPGVDGPLPVDEAYALMHSRRDILEAGITEAIPTVETDRERTEVFGDLVVTLDEDPARRGDRDYMFALALEALPKNWRKHVTLRSWAENAPDLQLPRTLTVDNIRRLRRTGEESTVTTTIQNTTMVGVPLVTRYFIVNRDNPALPDWETGYHSVDEAAAELPVGNTSPWPDRAGAWLPETYDVVGITRRASGAPVTSCTVTPTASTTNYVVSLQVVTCPRVIHADRKGWLLYYRAS